jgi:hypothetical protein
VQNGVLSQSTSETPRPRGGEKMWWDFFWTLTTSILIVELTSKGYLPIWIAASMLVVFVIFKAFARAIRGITKCAYWFFTILFFGVLIFFIVLKSGWHGWQNVVFILTGVIFSGFVEILTKMLVLAMEGYIGISLLILFTFLLVLFRRIGLEIGSVFVYHTIFSICAPLFILLVFLSKASHGNWREAVIVAGSLLAMVGMLEGIYIIAFGFFSATREKDR